MTTKEIYQKLHQFVKEVTLGYKGEIDLNLLREAAYRLEAMDAQIYQHREEIADLEKQLAENQPEWISVEDRLPKSEFVLCTDGKCCFVTTIPDMKDAKADGVTHWMPLPKPPKQKLPTFKDVFLKAFPKAQKYDEGTPVACAEDVFPQVKRHDNCDGRCDKCWNLPYFEPEGEGGEK